VNELPNGAFGIGGWKEAKAKAAQNPINSEIGEKVRKKKQYFALEGIMRKRIWIFQ
jgi:hypothetical protein